METYTNIFDRQKQIFSKFNLYQKLQITQPPNCLLILFSPYSYKLSVFNKTQIGTIRYTSPCTLLLSYHTTATIKQILPYTQSEALVGSYAVLVRRTGTQPCAINDHSPLISNKKLIIKIYVHCLINLTDKEIYEISLYNKKLRTSKTNFLRGEKSHFSLINNLIKTIDNSDLNVNTSSQLFGGSELKIRVVIVVNYPSYNSFILNINKIILLCYKNGLRSEKHPISGVLFAHNLNLISKKGQG